MKSIILGITASIAAYKSLEITRLLVKRSHKVIPILTPEANHFITPLSVESLSAHKAYCDFFQESESIIHISMTEEADLIAVVPATANFIGKLAAGIVDNLLLGTVFASNKPVLIAPAMNKRMWTNSIVRQNVEKLKNSGYHFVGPSKGFLASREQGIGRLEDIEIIIEEILTLLEDKKNLMGKKVLITFGRTKEYLDPVRYISNDSSGKFGLEIAKTARRKGAQVSIIAGYTDVSIPPLFSIKRVTNTAEMAEQVKNKIKNVDIVIMNAACSDFMAESVKKNKIRKTAKSLSVSLKRTKDILTLIKSKNKKRFIVGFSVDTKEPLKSAKTKMQKKGVDMMVVNPYQTAGSKTVKMSILLKNGKVTHYSLMPKSDAALKILDTLSYQF